MNIGPNITKDGLVLYYDAANIKSFRGEPTTNYDLLTNSNYYQRSNSYGSYCNITSGYYYGRYCYKIDLNIPTGTVFNSWKGAYFNINSSNLSSFGFINGDWVTRSFDVFVESHNDINYTRPSLSIEGNSINKTYIQIDRTILGRWQRVSCTSQIVDITQTNNYLFYVASHSAGTTTTDLRFVVYMGNAQLEKKSYDTHYTPTSRGNTISTGGGIVDISIKDNSSVNFSNISYNKNNNGVFNFSGNGTALNTSNLDLSYAKSASVSFWFKTISSSSQNFLELTDNYNNYSGSFLVNMNEFGVGTMYIGMHSSEGYNVVMTNTSGLNDNIWHHFVGIMDKGRNTNPQTQIYIDGISNYKDTGHNVILTTYFNNLPLYIASRNNSAGFYNGSLSQIMIYDRVLSAAEVVTIYGNQKSRYI